MTLNFELSIWLNGEGGTWSDSHRFPGRPDIETIKALMEGALNDYEILFGNIAEHRSVSLNYLEAEDREASEEMLNVREDAN